MTTETLPPKAAEAHLVRAYVSRERDHWTAVIPDFTIAGRGDTADAAAKNAAELLVVYLNACGEDGMSFADARRPAPWSWRARIAFGVTLRHLTGRRRRTAGMQERDLSIGSPPIACPS